MDCDILIRNGTIVDGTGSKSFRGDLAIKDGQIIALGSLSRDISPAQVIDAKEMVVSPGFIDVHSHAEFIIASPQHHHPMEPFIRQGITTMVTGNCGLSPAPINHDYLDQFCTYWTGILPQEGLPWNWNTMEEFLEHVEAVRPAVNIAQLVGHGTIRINVMGYNRRAASPKELQAMRTQVRQSLEEGALGLSFGLAYIPGVWANTDELIEVARDLPHYNGRITVHLRNYTSFIERSVEEMIRVAETVGVPLQLSHFVPFSLDYTEQFLKADKLTEDARTRGMDIGYDLLAHPVASTTLFLLYPPWMFEGGISEFFERLKDPDVRSRLIHEFKHYKPQWPSWETGTWPGHEFDEALGWSAYRLYGFHKPEYQQYEGLDLESIAKDLGKDSFEALFDLTLDEHGPFYYTSGFHDNEEIDRALGIFLRLPHMSLMTDAVGIGHRAPHPSHYGTYPRFLGRHVREWETLALEDAVRKCTSLPAAQLGLAGHGIIREGAHADIVIFDPGRITDKATFAEPFQSPDGIETVLINGVPVWHEGRYSSDSPAGQVMRRK